MQEVLDEKGQKRLHGAFTGGFSAGYFNTCGSKEGWAPATFVSSRSQRAAYKQQRPEDFMDAEDAVEEAVGGGKLIQETADFAGMGDRLSAKDALAGAAGAAASGLLMPDELLVSAEAETDPIGFRLLRTMGWREGHGVGPRRRRAPKGTVPPVKPPRAAVTAGPGVAADSGEDEGGAGGDEAGPDPFAADFKFAPKDVELFAIEAPPPPPSLPSVPCHLPSNIGRPGPAQWLRRSAAAATPGRARSSSCWAAPVCIGRLSRENRC